VHRLLCILFVILLPACADATSLSAAVDHVLNGKSFVITAGDTVRLAGIEAPNTEEPATTEFKARPGEPLGQEAKNALVAVLKGNAVRIDTVPTQRDRHNRLVGQVYTQDGAWVQGAMLRDGWAMVYSFADDDPQTVQKMLVLENEAQVAKRGIWADPYFRVIGPKETANFINRFKLVEGRVTSANTYHGNLYINFSWHWKGQFAVFISHKFLPAFSLPTLLALPGKTIRVRGWIDYHNAPMIDVDHPQQIEILG
jgi:endonuclease YncB( thermonuclease family)